MNNLIKILIVIVIAMIAFGAVMVFTASGTYSLIKFNSLYSLFRSHLWKVVAAAIAMYIFSIFPYDKYRSLSKWALIGIIILLVLTVLLAPKINNARRWLFFFQPSEIAKVVLIAHTAVMIERMGDDIKDFKKGFIYPLFWVGLVSGLVLIQPNVSTCLIISMTSFALLFVSGAKLKHIFGIVVPAITVVGTIAMIFEHSRIRILSFVNSLLYGADINDQVTQSKIALGSGGLFGIGPGHTRQSDLFVPESYSDFIYSIIGEQTGFLGAALILFIYLALFIICMIIAKKAQDKFGQLLVLGLGFNIIITAFVNAAVVTGMIPTTGITLPFISFGGTSIILFAVSVGIIVNVGRQTIKTEVLKIAQV
jgi:cell division protein FtsW